MTSFFTITLVVSIVLFALGIARPQLALCWGKNKTRKKVIVLYGIIAFISTIGLIVVATPTPNDYNFNTTQQKIEKLNVWDKIIISFEGGYDKKLIKEKMDLAMTLYDVDLTEQNYEKTASALIAMRKEFGVQEMKILEYVILMYSPKIKMTLADAIGYAATAIVTGN